MRKIHEKLIEKHKENAWFCKNFPRFARLLNFYSTRNTNLATGHWTPSRVCAMFLHLTPSIYTDAVVPEVGRPGIRKKSENDHENAKNAKKLAQNAKFSASFFRTTTRKPRENHAKTTQTLPSPCERIRHILGGVFLTALILSQRAEIKCRDQFKTWKIRKNAIKSRE